MFRICNDIRLDGNKCSPDWKKTEFFWRLKMPTLRQQYDADLEREYEPTPQRTETNIHPVNCGVCGQMIYVDQATFDHFENAIECDADNQFVCLDCERENEEEVFE